MATSFRIASLLASVSLAILATSANAQPYDIDTYLAFREPTRTAMARDASVALFSVEAFDREHDRRTSTLQLMTRNANEARVFAEGENPAFCSGDRVGYTRREGASVLFHVVRNDGSNDRAITGLSVTSFSCDPRQPRAVLIASERPPVQDLRTPAPETHLYVADFETGAFRQLSDITNATTVDWSPDGTAIAATVSNDIVLVSLDGARTPLVTRPGVDTTPRWSPDGRMLAFATADGVERAPVGLAIVDRRGGAPRPIARDFQNWTIGPPPRWFAWQDQRTLLFAGLSEMTTRIYRASVGSNAVTPLTPEQAGASGCSVARNILTCIESTPSQPPRIVQRSLPRGDVLTSLETNPHFDESIAVRRVDWRASDGTAVSGLLASSPTGCQQHCPMVVLMVGSHGTFDYSYTSRTSADDTWFPPHNAHILVGAGYTVLMPNPRGSWGYGAAFQRAIVGNPAIGPTDDVESGVNAMVEAGIADPNRLAIVGVGIFDTYRLAYDLTKTTRYRAAIAALPLFDLAHYYGAGNGAQRRYLGGSPLSEPERFAAIDPSQHGASITTPTLLFQRDNDAPAAIGGHAAMFAAVLKENNVPVTVLEYPELFVAWPKPSEVGAAARASLDFLSTHMQPRP